MQNSSDALRFNICFLYLAPFCIEGTPAPSHLQLISNICFVKYTKLNQAFTNIVNPTLSILSGEGCYLTKRDLKITSADDTAGDITRHWFGYICFEGS